MTNPFDQFKLTDVEQSIPDRFEAQVLKNPGRIAIQTPLARLSYAELNQTANRLAELIRRQLGEGEHRVALWLEHDPSLIVAIFAILKAGSTCVPLEPSYPEARAAYILEDSQPELIVTSFKNLALVRMLVRGQCEVLDIDRVNPTVSVEDFSSSVPPDTLAYILYTSGSTGHPKGVVHTHRNALRNVMAYTNALQICGADRVSLLASCSSGLGMATTLTTLLNGATLLPYDIRKEGLDSLASWLIKEEITVFNSAATVFRHLARTLTGKEVFPHIRLIRLGGERVHKSDVELYRRYFGPQCVLVNALSSTETGNFTNFLIDKNTEIPGDIVPVGYPVQGIEVLLLDDSGEEVSNGCAGEIAVKSRYLFQGYWRKPEQTKAALFPLEEGGNERIYRTGDVGRKRPDGALEHLGRKDFQVRIRGYRVELEEIETILRRHPAVQLAVVEAREDHFGDSSLVAYVVPCQGQTPTSNELRDHLKQNLPDHMLPASFVYLDALPLTPHGKVDRNRLSRIGPTSPEVTSGFVAPRSPVEEAVARIWTTVLGLKQAGIHDSFFDVGGHSLTATQVTSRLRSEFGLELTLQEFARNSTIAELAERIERHLASRKTSLPSPIRPAPRDQDLPPSFAQQRLWLLDQLDPGSAVYNVHRVVKLVGPLNVRALEQGLSEIVRRHESLRTTFPYVNGQPVQSITAPQPVGLRIIDLQSPETQKREEEALEFIYAEIHRPFNLERGPLFRPVLVKLAESEHWLVMTLHHIITDRWSRWILTQELKTLYRAFSANQPSPLPDLPVQYADYAVWQRGWLQGEVLDEQLSYWKRQLGGELPVLELPTDHPRPAVPSYRGGQVRFELAAELSRELRQLSRQEGVTLFMTLLAAFQVLLYRY
ncbi:MAG TPA: amino acid adenylation domain-containing protein, partial [Terriglobia bacterium]|nr:amino acid adenylation domain-containing protein [Terriglobia bacterium]